MQYANDGVATTPRAKGSFRNRTPQIIAAVGLVAVISVGLYVANNAASTSEDATTAAVTTDTALLEEATPFRIAEPGITTNYFGYSGELFPEEVAPDPLSRSLTERQLDWAYRAPTAEANAGTASIREQELMESLVNQGLIPAAALEGADAASVDSGAGSAAGPQQDALDRAIANGRLTPPVVGQQEDALHRAIANGRLTPPDAAAQSRPGGPELGRIGEPMP